MSLMVFCFFEANSSSHLSNRRYWGNVLKRRGADMSAHEVRRMYYCHSFAFCIVVVVVLQGSAQTIQQSVF